MLFITNGYGQKGKTKGYKAEILSLEQTQRSFLGERYIMYWAEVEVKSKDSLAGNYYIEYPEMDREICHLTVMDTAENQIEPKVRYNSQTLTFTLFEGTDKVQNKILNKALEPEHVILQGMLFWLSMKD